MQRTGVRPKLRLEAGGVLIVDDAEDNRAIYGEYFAHHGWHVSHAVDGEHALLKILSVMPDVVLMDLAMPIIDGWEATKRIKAHPKTKHIPVICITGLAASEHLQRAHDLGVDAVLLKPCAPAMVFQIASRLLHRSADSTG